ncbi:unnamed protein product [Danaus chrysippus]|uniref:(African queen) hypothetical protein n=1 Tax=Danaus chrysippus TaxID=151541 RepID=A0A8J2WB53_9NEOP|nr:unnamed protein product [Danaus chrysippus]
MHVRFVREDVRVNVITYTGPLATHRRLNKSSRYLCEGSDARSSLQHGPCHAVLASMQVVLKLTVGHGCEVDHEVQRSAALEMRSKQQPRPSYRWLGTNENVKCQLDNRAVSSVECPELLIDKCSLTHSLVALI